MKLASQHNKYFFSDEMWTNIQRMANSINLNIENITNVSGDASGREYWRIYYQDKTAILMSSPTESCYAPGEESENERLKLGYDSSARRNKHYLSAFCHVQALLARNNIPTPQIYAVDIPNGLAILEDFGLVNLNAARELGLSDDLLISTSMEVLKKLGQINKHAYQNEKHVDWLIESMDHLALKTESNLFAKHYLPLRLGRQLSDSESKDWDAELSCALNLLKTDTLILRDFHSPNILCRFANERLNLGVIDFQDALWGDPMYDFASLMYDARFSWPVESVDNMVKSWSRIMEMSVDEIEEKASIVSLQRNLKILGAFIMLSSVGDNRYLKHIPRVSRYLEQALSLECNSSIKSFLKDVLGTRALRL